MGEASIGILGFGHIGKTIAARAKAFGMRVTVAVRSRVSEPDLVDQFFALSALPAFMESADTIVCTLPLTAGTVGLIGARALAAMRSSAVLMNIGRGPVVDETRFTTR